MAALAERASPTGVVLLHENEKDIYGDVPDRVLDIVESVGSPPCGWPGTPPTTCRWASPRSATATRGCARTPTTSRSRTRCCATGEVVPAGEGDGQVRETVRALAADGFDGFFSMEPHLGTYNEFGALSGPANFTRATRAFTAILDSEGIAYR